VELRGMRRGADPFGGSGTGEVREVVRISLQILPQLVVDLVVRWRREPTGVGVSRSESNSLEGKDPHGCPLSPRSYRKRWRIAESASGVRRECRESCARLRLGLSGTGVC
jgi:hypothetical protein